MLVIARWACNLNSMERSVICAILLGYLCALPAPALASAVAIGATPSNSPSSWITADDYPVEALRAKEGGNTGFELSIDEHGVVTGCQIVESSGAASLDNATCALVSQRAHFNPATDQDGRAVAGTYQSKVHWAMPLETLPPVPAAGTKVERVIVETDGVLTHCEYIDPSDRKRQFQPEPCLTVWQPYRDATGRPLRKMVTTTITVTIKDAPN